MSQHDNSPAQAVLAASSMIQSLDPGPLAELRRMKQGSCAPAFWRLVARHPETIGQLDRQETWMTIVRIFAILTPKGPPVDRPKLHDSRRRLGEVLCDGGDPSWTGPRPMFSERRLAQLMAARGSQRAVLLERALHALSRSMPFGSRVNVVDVAYALLAPENGRLLAEPYYRRLDRAERDAKRSNGGAT